ncbi:MAG: YgiT-type zinc finger protein [Anaerolineae bacterium]|nr:YgiT-type zinc finger protein [Anaerolineae bacterium]
MNFWEGETCECCGSPIIEGRTTLHRKADSGYVILEDVPVGICIQCGTRYFAANVLKTIEDTVRGRRKAEREVLVPVYSF